MTTATVERMSSLSLRRHRFVQTTRPMSLVDAACVLGERVGVRIRDRVETFDVVKAPFVAPHVR
jgi:hypothetical protein